METNPRYKNIRKIGIFLEYAEKAKKKRCNFLEWIRNNLSFDNLLYAGSGFDIAPKIIFGENRVIHLSLEENAPTDQDFGYFDLLGQGVKIKGDFCNAPLKNESLDAVYIHGSPFKSTFNAIPEFSRILKNKGCLILDNDDWCMHEIPLFIHKLRQMFDKVVLPKSFCDPNATYRIIINTHGSDRHCGQIVGIAADSTSAVSLLNKILPEHRCMISQQFIVARKKPVS